MDFDYKALNNFYKEFEGFTPKVQIGDFYRNYTLELDPFHRNRAAEYREIEMYQRLGANGSPTSIVSFRYKVMQWLHHIVSYFVGEFTDTNEPVGIYEDFHNIWRRFFQEFYYKEVYVGYGEELRLLEVKSWKGREDIIPEKCEVNSKFRLFRLIKNGEKGQRHFSSVFTGIEYIIDEKRTPLVRASCNDGWNWIWWWELISEFVGVEQNFLTSIDLTLKRLILREKNVKNTRMEEASLLTRGPIFKVNNTEAFNKNEYDALDLLPPEGPKLIFDSMMNWWEFRASMLCFLQNQSDKKERLTSGENYKDLKALSNFQQQMLNQLNKFARDLKKAYPFIKLNFNLAEWGNPSPAEEYGSPGGQKREGDNHPSMDISWQKRHEQINKEAFKK